MHTDPLGVSIMVVVVGLILKALWDLKTAPNGADVRAALAASREIERRFARIESDIHDVNEKLGPIHDHITRLRDREERHDAGADD